MDTTIDLKSLFGQRIAENMSRRLGEEVSFFSEYFPTIPAKLVSSNVLVQARYRYTSNSKVDNLVLRLEKCDATAIGLWILSVLFNPSVDFYRIELAKSERVDEIRMVGVAPANTPHFVLQQFRWKPRSVSNSVPFISRPKHGKASVRLTNEKDDWFDETTFLSRNILTGFGDVYGACSVAEFFLNLGLACNDLNYEVLMHQDEHDNLLDNESCEFRVEIDKIIV